MYEGAETEDDWKFPVGAPESSVYEWPHLLLLPEVSLFQTAFSPTLPHLSLWN